jgi:hypothetical protein
VDVGTLLLRHLSVMIDHVLVAAPDVSRKSRKHGLL